MAAADISAQLALEVSEATGGGGKPYIRHGKYYELLVTRCHSKAVKMEDTKFHNFAFMEFKVLKAEPHAKGVIPVSKQNKDDGTNPNPVGSLCSHSVDFSGNGAAMAGQNVREFVAGLFGVNVDELSKEDAFRTWVDLCRKEDVRAGGVDYVDPKTNQPVLATKDKVANMGCGFIIALSTSAKELKETRKVKEMADEDRKYFTQKNWICLAKPGTGVNAPDLVAKRRAEILLEVPMDEDDEAESTVNVNVNATNANGATPAQQQQQQQQNVSPPVPPAAPIPPAPVEVAADWPPPPPWIVGGTSKEHSWLTAPWVWKPGLQKAIHMDEYKAGKRE